MTRIEDNPRLNEFTFERALNYPYGRPNSSFLFGTRDGSHTPVDDPTVDLLKNRHAVLAIGSNASPEQLYRKYAHDLGVIPVISASLNDFDAVFAASITRYGSVPATLLESPGTTVDCHVTFLTDEQLAVMDETEGIGVAYERVVFDSEKVNISVGWAGPFWHYRSLQPPLLVNGEPVSFAALPAQHRKFHSESEAEILGLVARSLRVSTRRLFEASIADPAFRDSTEKEVLSGGLADDGHYFNSLHGTMSCDHMKARGSPYVVVVRDEVYGDLKRHLRPAYAVIRAKAPVTEPPQAVKTLHLIAEVVSESTALDSARKLGAQPPALLETAHARVDETIRVALGFQKTLVPGEWIATDFSIHPLRIQSRAVLGSWVARFFGRRHLLLRVAKPEPADVEKNICRIRDHDLITMGTKSGNRVVLQSVHENGEGFELTRLSIQALALTSEIIKERHDLESDQQSLGWNADYVNARTLVSQRNHDLAYTMIDFQNREVLGLEPGFPVLARRDISSAFFNEFLEFGVVVLTSFLALQVVLNPIWRSLNVGAMGRGLLDLTMSLLSSTLLITLRLRSDIR